MKRLPIKQVKPGMVIAEDIFSNENSVLPLIMRGTRLTSVLIDKIADTGEEYIRVKSDPVRPRKPIVIDPRATSIPKPEPVISKELHEDAVGSIESLFDTIRIDKEDVHAASLLIQHLDQVVEQLVDSLEGDAGAIVNINDLKSFDEYTYSHSLSVAVLSIAIGQYIGFDHDRMGKLGKCAIMHDIGKTAVPIEILHKPSRLSDEEFSIMKTHSAAGYEYMRARKIDNEEIRRGILGHHEKFDGSGYPLGLKGENIPVMSRIISVADVYDALTSVRPYRNPANPSDAIEYIMGGVDTFFDYDVVNAFLKKVELYPVGSYVELSNGRTAMVIDNENTLRPVVRLMDTLEDVDLYGDLRYLSVVLTRVIPD